MGFLGHVALALAIQALIGASTKSWWAGAGVASAYFIGRELAQAEYRWIEMYGEGLRANMPWWAPFDSRVWPKADQWLDWIAPSGVTACVAWLHGRRSS
ncbi:hypothetical protein [Novosphingobium sp. M1R2S20]|uniref:Uncharacterized protein n=1 Tax=Novosphingobium rhizovicinum TaxID=3228928 RepID=A0ABV3R7Q1_9SPHN